jgi:ubiquinone/menaquinone biosynthesis C-methylase UbiE
MTQSQAKSEVVDAYNNWAETYDTDPNLTRDLAAQALKQADLNFAGRRIIEVGCGTGRNTEWLARSAAGAKHIIALDFAREMLSRASARMQDPRVRFLQHDVRAQWPLADASADVIVVMLILEHIEQLGPMFVEAARTLNVNGQLFICELHPARQLLGKQARFIHPRTGEQTLVPAFLHQTDDYLKAAAAAGFELVHMADWHNAAAQTDDPPRLLSLHFNLSVTEHPGIDNST